MNFDVSFIIPAYNESARITSTIEALVAAATATGRAFEVIVVDDGSTDGTAAVVEETSRRLGVPLRVIAHAKNRGKGAAVKTGMLAASGAFRLFLDADGSTDVEALPQTLAPLSEGRADVVVGSRGVPGTVIVRHQARRRELLGRIGNRLIQALYLPGIRDSQCGWKGFTAGAALIAFQDLRSAGWMSDVESLVRVRRAGLRVLEIPVRWTNAAESKVRLKSYLQSLVELISLRRHL